MTFDDGGNYAALGAANGFGLHLFRRDLMAEAVHRTALPARAEAQDPVTLIFASDDIDATAQRLREHGTLLDTDPTDREAWGIRTLNLRDLDGNLIEVNQPLPRE